jgi:hypothetical protein
MSKVSFVIPGAATPEVVTEAPVIEVKATDIISTVSHVAPDGSVKTEVVDVSPAESIPGASPVAAVIPVTSALPVQGSSPVAFNDEELGFDDIILPRLNIVQKVGDLSNIYTPGEIVLNQSFVIYTAPVIQEGVIVKQGTPVLNVTVLGFKKKQFVEKVSGGAQGAFVNTLEEVAKLGGTLDYKEHEEKTKLQIPCKLFQHYATALVLVECPLHVKDEDHVQFPYECEGKFYALCLWGMKGTAYTNGAKTFFTARKIGHLRASGYAAASWSLGTKMVQYKGDNKFAFIPVLKPGTKHNEAFATFVKDVLGCGK